MHTVELLDHALEAAVRLGFKIRQDWLGGSWGVCEIRGQRWIFLDVAQSATERLSLVIDTIRDEPGLHRMTLIPDLARLLDMRLTA
ncbi:MAG TPA: hypothetical protein VHZ24_21065 [Pirellulales bacterium]|jgi:hypothetical protein|nr:hypothetical protein [Pirellulales bacterium]